MKKKSTNRGDGRFEMKRTIGHDAEGNGVRKSFYGRNRQEAMEQYISYMEAKNVNAQEKKAIPFDEWAERWLVDYKKPDVREITYQTTYARPTRLHIIPHFGGVILQDITQLDIKRFINKYLDHSQSFINKLMICLKGIFEAAVDNELISRNPCRNVKAKSKKAKTQKRTYDKETVDVLCGAAAPYALYVHILLDMGLRCSELCGLRWEDVDFEAQKLKIRRALTTDRGKKFLSEPKSFGSIRTLPIPPRLMARLEKERKEDGFIAVRGKNNITPDHFGERELEVFYNAVGVPEKQRLSPHELRHTCGTLLYEATKDIYHVSKFLGHSDIGITVKTYVHSEMQTEAIHVAFEAPKSNGRGVYFTPEKKSKCRQSVVKDTKSADKT